MRDGCVTHFLDGEKLFQYERLQKGKLEALQFNRDIVELPASDGICYLCKGAQFEYG